MTEISDLPPRERAARYRAIADDAERYGGRSKGSVRDSYSLMAKQWRRLAEEADAAAEKWINSDPKP